ncbi:MAG: hypothetical protein Q7T72_12695, partial [Bacteroidales bacterium]|nr:hypothetical protein [Bacteroidales bacterium]
MQFRICCYFNENGVHSKPALTELLIKRITANGIKAILNSCGKKRWKTRKAPVIKNKILNQTDPV